MKTANSKANATTKELLNWLAGLSNRPDKRVISGQQLWHGEDAGDGYIHFVERLNDATGKWVGIIGLDYCKPWIADGITDLSRETVNSLAIDWWDAGGLVAFTWLTRNPWTGGEYHNRNNPDWDPRAHDLRELIEPGQLNDFWMTQLDSVADGFTILRDAGVVVLWRPFSEATYDATQGQWGFWWNSPHDPPAYVALWRQMFDYFTVERGLDNLLWVYNAANQDNWRPLDIVYPGDDVVDLVSVDVYADEIIIQGDGYNRLVALGKPFYFAETGPAYGQGQATGGWDTLSIIRAIRERYPEAVAWLSWFSWDENHQVALIDNQNASALLSDPWVITRDKVDWRFGLISDEIIIDDADAGFSTSFSQDAWQKHTEDGGQHYGNSHYYNRKIGSGQDTATWSFTVPKPGNYDVYAWWWEGDWRPSDVPYTVNHFYDSTTVRVDQRANGGQWNLLGTFYWHDEGSVVVSDDVSSGRDIVADAIRLVYRSGGEKKTLREELELLRAKLEALNVVDGTAMLVHVDNALARLEELEAAKEEMLGIE
jgi:mannan endo-1,4-beta-mannosidase